MRGVVFMGMGEPLLNYENVDPRGAHPVATRPGRRSRPRRSPSRPPGWCPAIRRFTAEGHHFRLIVSLGAPTTAERRPLMPIEKRWPLPRADRRVRDYADRPGDALTLAYVVIGGVNTTPAHARALGELLARDAR